MRRIRELEDEVALMREGYNHAVEIFNTRVARFPDIALAALFRFKSKAFFQGEAQTTVPVKYA